MSCWDEIFDEYAKTSAKRSKLGHHEYLSDVALFLHSPSDNGKGRDPCNPKIDLFDFDKFLFIVL